MSNSTECLVVIIMGSRRDLDHAQRIRDALGRLGVVSELRVASAHKTVGHLVDMLRHYEAREGKTVYVAVAGRSNALAGMVDANVSAPVITCPPLSSAFGGADIYSSLRMPSGVAPMVVLEPEAAALAAAKCLAVSNPELRRAIVAYQREVKDRVVEDDQVIRRPESE